MSEITIEQRVAELEAQVEFQAELVKNTQNFVNVLTQENINLNSQCTILKARLTKIFEQISKAPKQEDMIPGMNLVGENVTEIDDADTISV